jgi:hypothetical protein
MRLCTCILILTFRLSAQHQPDLGAQAAAMKKLEFLKGTWTGEATMMMGPQPLKLNITDDVQFKQDGLLLVLERIGRDAAGKVIFSALATVAYDDASRQYRFRAHSSGKFMDAPFQAGDKSYEWTFAEGPATVRHVMRLGSQGEWVEFAELVSDKSPPRKAMVMTTRKPQGK